jgi:hypothetical protein
MAGVRVTHPTARNCRFTVVESDRPYREPYHCTPPDLGGCGSVHLFKTHHLNLDETGSVTIGDVLYQKIRPHLVANDFAEANIVKKPPTMGIGLAGGINGTWGNIPIIHGKG